MKRFDEDLLQDGYIGGKDVAGTGKKKNHLGLGYRFNRPFGSVAPLNDYDYVVQRTNEKGNRIGLFASDIHKAIDKSKLYGGEYLDLEDRKQLQYLEEEKRKFLNETSVMRDIANVKKRRS